MKYVIYFLGAAAVCLAAFSTLSAQTPNPADGDLFPEGAVILFQGDSITDGNRGRNDDPNHIHGHGYVYLIASYLGANFPEKNWTFYNRGVSGDTVARLSERWQEETIDIQPDVLSILIGVNDMGNETPEEYEAKYDRLLAETKAALPNVKFVLIEPFRSGEGGPEAACPYQEAAARLAEKYHAPYVALQDVFEKLIAEGGDECRWIWDGVHPTTAGHWIIFTRWLDAVRKADF